MSKPLVIVESPAKARTITNYLKDQYIVKASVGHVKDLPESRLGVDIESGFIPEYSVIKGKIKVLKEIKKFAEKAEADLPGHRPGPGRRGHCLAHCRGIETALGGTSTAFSLMRSRPAASGRPWPIPNV